MIAQVLNIEYRVDRRTSAIRELDRMGFQHRIVDAPRVSADGYLGCALGHFYAVKRAMAEGVPMASQIIMEDDAIFLEPRETFDVCLQKFLEARGNNWDALFIGCMYQGYFDRHKDWFVKPIGMNQTTAYILNERFVPEWLEYLMECVSRRMKFGHKTGIIDQDWAHLINGRDIFCTNPKLVTQADNYSDIRNDLVYGGDYKPLNK